MSVRASRAAWSHIAANKISIPARLVILALANRHNQETGRCDPSVARICLDTKLSERAVRLALRELEKCRAIQTVHRQQRTGLGTKNMANRYKIFGLSSGARHAGGMGHDMPPNHKYSAPSEAPSQFDDLAMLLDSGDDDE